MLHCCYGVHFYFNLQACQEVTLLVKVDNLRQLFDDNFSVWCKAVILYCRETQLKTTALQEETEEYTDDLGDGMCI